MPDDIALQLAPLHPDPYDLGVEDGARLWRANSSDPAFTASVPEPARPLQPGWYRARAILDSRSGDVRDPRLYIPDAAGRYSEDRAVPMVREGPAYTAEFFLAHPSDRLRFDPSTSRCEFACEALHVASIERPTRPAPRRRPSLARVPGLATLRRIGGTALAHVRARLAQRLARKRNAERKRRVLATIDRNGLGVEIGPSHDPIAPKREGFRVHVIDHASREELIAKYSTHTGLPLDRIEEVDFVWKGQSYLELTGTPKHYDWIIASHLIEHTPDLIAFLEDCDSILKDGGVLSLVIPDKRYCFDRFRPITGLARVIDSHVAGNRIHSAGTVAEFFMNVAVKGHALAWDERTRAGYDFIHSAGDAKKGMSDVLERHAYLDVHNWCFVPHSFRLILADLHALGYTKLREVGFDAPGGYEFYVTLGRHGAGPALSRLEIMKAIDAEVAAVNGR
jgi:SAM-dependent methyltransferase